MSSSSAPSSGVWLSPPSSGTNSSSVGTSAARCWASWPAPDQVSVAAMPWARRRAARPARPRSSATGSPPRTSSTSRRRRGPGDLGGVGADRGVEPGERLPGDPARVDPQARAARDHADRAGRDLERPDGRHRLRRLGARGGLDRQDELGGGGERVAAVLHRDLAGVAGPARDLDLAAAGRRDARRRRRAARSAASLGDVDLGVGAHARSRAVATIAGSSASASRYSARACAALTPAASTSGRARDRPACRPAAASRSCPAPNRGASSAAQTSSAARPPPCRRASRRASSSPSTVPSAPS